jgi:hypothetical protein
VSLGGRVVLLNSILNSIPIFYLSVMKMAIEVWKKIVQIHRNFLCVCVWGGGGGVNSTRKIVWGGGGRGCR